MSKKAKSIRLEEELHNRATVAGKTRGLGVEETYTEALTKWLDGLSGTASEGLASGILHDIHNGGINKSELPWVNRLLKILRSENKTITEAIHRNLEAFCLVIEATSEQHSGHVPAVFVGISEGTKELIGRTESAVGRGKRIVETAQGREKSADRDIKKSG